MHTLFSSGAALNGAVDSTVDPSAKLGLGRAVSDRLGGLSATRSVRSDESGQASVEYALVLLGAALVATLLIGWATKTDLLDGLFDHVLNLIKGKAQ